MCLRNAARRRMVADAKAVMETHASVTRRWFSTAYAKARSFVSLSSAHL